MSFVLGFPLRDLFVCKFSSLNFGVVINLRIVDVIVVSLRCWKNEIQP